MRGTDEKTIPYSGESLMQARRWPDEKSDSLCRRSHALRVGRSRSTMRCICRSLSSTMARQVLPTSWTHGHCFSTIHWHMLRSHMVQVSPWTACTDVFRTYPVSTSVEARHF